MIISGIDEAGRGPVIGPLVIGIACIDEKDEHKLKALGVKDSKLLAPLQRERIAEELKKICKYELVKLSPSQIDEAVLSEHTNLNWLEADTGIMLINKFKPDKAYIDCPSANEKAYKQYLIDRLDKSHHTELIVEHKADYKYLIVGAASILAKVARDAEIEALKKKYDVNFGSGYPADPLTKEFTANNFDKYPFFRKSWASWKNAAHKEDSQKKLSGF
jgi:ribonuclease HII